MTRRIRNLCVAAFMAVMASGTVSAEDTVTSLVLERTDGTKATFALSDSPVLTISAGELTARSVKEEVTVPIDGLTDYHFIHTPDGIDEVSDNDGFSIEKGTATFSNLKEGEQLNIYTIDGLHLDTLTAPADGHVSLDLKGYGKGIIIIQTEHGSYKVNNR